MILLLPFLYKFDIRDQILSISLFTRTLIHCVKKQLRVLDSSLDHRPQLLDQQTKTRALVFRLLDLLVKQFFTVFQKLNQFLVFCLQLLNFFDVPSLFVLKLVDGLTLLIKFRIENAHVVLVDNGLGASQAAGV